MTKVPVIVLLCLLRGAPHAEAQAVRRLQLGGAGGSISGSSGPDGHSNWRSQSAGAIRAGGSHDPSKLIAQRESDDFGFTREDGTDDFPHPSGGDPLHMARLARADEVSDGSSEHLPSQPNDGAGMRTRMSSATVKSWHPKGLDTNAQLLTQADGDDFGESFEDGTDDFPHPSDFDAMQLAQADDDDFGNSFEDGRDDFPHPSDVNVMQLAQADGDDFGNSFEDGRDDFPHPSDSDAMAWWNGADRKTVMLGVMAGFGGGFAFTAIGALLLRRRRRTHRVHSPSLGHLSVRRTAPMCAAPCSSDSRGLESA